MKCPKCGEEVYDIYTTKERIDKLYQINTIAGWARENLAVLSEMLKSESVNILSGPERIKWIKKEIDRIKDKIEVVKE
jgi:hypothetical protein